MLPRLRLNWLATVGWFFAFLTAVSLWYCGKNTLAYLRMRHADVVVSGSRLTIFSSPATSSDPEDQPWPFEFKLHLTLDTVGDSPPRRIVEDLELDHAAYAEEAYDELAFWAPGTRHKIQLLRGDAREVRLGAGQANPEFDAAIGLLLCAGFCLLFAIAMLTAAGIESRTSRFGPWIIFAAVGALALLGAAALVWNEATKARTWQRVEARVIETDHQWDPASAPAGTKIEPAAIARLTERKYRIAEFRLGDRVLHAGLGGARKGALDELKDPGDTGVYRFRVNPANRFEIASGEAWGRDFQVALGALLFFGLAFGGAGLSIRRARF